MQRWGSMCLFVAALFADACNGGPCCPIKGELAPSAEWNCPLVDNVVTYRVEFRNAEGELCRPSTSSSGVTSLWRLNVLNEDGSVRDKMAAPFVNPQDGVYESPPGGVPLKLDRTAVLQLKVVAVDEDCVPLEIEKKVFVVTADSKRRLCLPHNGEPFPNGFWTDSISTRLFGSGILVKAVENPNPFEIKVSLHGQDDTIGAGAPPSTGLAGLPANGTWVIRIPDQQAYSSYFNSPQGKELCIIVHLKC